MKLDVIFKCSRPVLFENEDETYSYSIRGTCFIVTFANRTYVITAKHNLKDFSLSQTRVQYSPEGRDFLPLAHRYLLKDLDPDDTDQTDLAIFDVEDEGIDDRLFDMYPPYRLLFIDGYTIFSEGSKYGLRGYPTETRDLDWINRHISQYAVIGEGSYLRRSPAASCHELGLLNIAAFPELDGLSGSPVFQINDLDEVHSAEAFAGMLLRGTRSSARATFLEHAVITNTLLKVKAADFSTVLPERVA